MHYSFKVVIPKGAKCTRDDLLVLGNVSKPKDNFVVHFFRWGDTYEKAVESAIEDLKTVGVDYGL